MRLFSKRALDAPVGASARFLPSLGGLASPCARLPFPRLTGTMGPLVLVAP